MNNLQNGITEKAVNTAIVSGQIWIESMETVLICKLSARAAIESPLCKRGHFPRRGDNAIFYERITGMLRAHDDEIFCTTIPQ
jgi:hypothetical protein